MSGNPYTNLPMVRRLVLGSLRLGKWIFSAIWLVVIAGIAVNTFSTLLTSRKFDLVGTPLGWIIQNPPLMILSGFCLLLLTILIWVVYFFLERDSLWLYTPEKRQRSKMHGLFATYIEGEIERIISQEDWKDSQFTELEAEVEARGRVKSLSAALKKSSEKIILLEGDSGSGKSFALLHVAREMIVLAKKLESVESVLPIYVNMKELKREQREEIDRNLIERFIKSFLTRRRDPSVQNFLNGDDFHEEILNGTLFFLLDSFDEIPEILSSTENDDKVNEYGNAIDAFLTGMSNKCCGVIASRSYRGQTLRGWTKFRILPLSEKRQLELISKTGLEPKAREIVGQLANANQTIRSMASNPFYLALLCKHLETGNEFPENIHIVFETYMNQRFADDKKLISIRKHLQPDTPDLRLCAEEIAFCMTDNPKLGLSPTRKDLQEALISRGEITNDPRELEKIFDALEDMGLARPDTKANTDLPKSFTFAHRRFQEYFATCFVLRKPELVLPQELLTSSLWREAAVVLCQTQPTDKLTFILKQAERALVQDINTFPTGPLDDLSSINFTQPVTPASFPWPPKLLHVLELLQDGFAGHLSDIPEHISQLAGRVMICAALKGNLLDKKWALEVAGILPKPELEALLKTAFSSESQMLREVAYRQVGKLSSTPPDIAQGIHNALIELDASNRLHQQRNATRTHLARLPQPARFLAILNLLLWLPSIDSFFHIFLWFLFLIELFSIRSPWNGSIQLFLLLIEAMILFSSHMIFRIRHMIFWLSKNMSAGPPADSIVLYSAMVRILLLITPFSFLFLDGHSSISSSSLSYRSFFLFFDLLPIDFWNWAKSFLLHFFPLNILVAGICVFTATFAPSVFLTVKGDYFIYSKAVMNSLLLLLIMIYNAIIFGLIFSVIFLALPIFGYAITLFLSFFLDASISNSSTVSLSIFLIPLVSSIICIIYTIYIIILFVKDIFRYHDDQQKFQRWQNINLKSKPCHELIDGVTSFYLKSFCIKFIKVIRKQKLLEAQLVKTEELLKNVIFDIEKEKQISKQKAKNRRIAHPNTTWPTKYTPADKDKYRNFLAKADADVLDELYQWLENIQDQKRPTQ